MWHGLGFDRIFIIELRIFWGIVPYCPKISSKSWIKFLLLLGSISYNQTATCGHIPSITAGHWLLVTSLILKR
ncbi:MAG: hypothetical protein P5678_22035 [Limnospira sp. PMC 1240.20]|nr:hypothetical protein [Limnospira sp. PMC 1240.20]